MHKDKDSNKSGKMNINNPDKDVLTPLGELSWKDKEDERSINADEMFDDPPIAGSAGVEC